MSWLDKYEDGGVIKDDRGQWAHPGKITEIGSNRITMKGVKYPVLGISDEGDEQIMYPEGEYSFYGEKVTEIPLNKAQDGIKMSNVISDEEITNSKKWINNYLNSPKYKERTFKEFTYSNPFIGSELEDQYEKDKEIRFNEETKEALKLINTSSVDAYKKEDLTLWNGLKRMLQGKEERHYGSSYSPKNEISIVRDQLIEGDDSTNESTMAHELSHNTKIPVDFPIKDYASRQLQNIEQEHDLDIEETKADIYGLRYLMHKYKINDAGKEDFTEETLKKVKKSLKTDGVFKRLQRLYSDEDIIYLMNTIADNSKSNWLDGYLT